MFCITNTCTKAITVILKIILTKYSLTISLNYICIKSYFLIKGAISYIELALMIRKSGGEYQYLTAAYGEV